MDGDSGDAGKDEWPTQPQLQPGLLKTTKFQKGRLKTEVQS